MSQRLIYQGKDEADQVYVEVPWDVSVALLPPSSVSFVDGNSGQPQHYTWAGTEEEPHPWVTPDVDEEAPPDEDDEPDEPES
jgi:hypothetical protein